MRLFPFTSSNISSLFLLTFISSSFLACFTESSASVEEEERPLDAGNSDSESLNTKRDASLMIDAEARVDASSDSSLMTFIPYSETAIHSPLSEFIVSNFRELRASGIGLNQIFAKIGDSNTVNTNFLRCFSQESSTTSFSQNMQDTREYFATVLADGTANSFTRTTLAAKVGWGTRKVLEGSPSPLEQEFSAIHPGIAIILLGTNDTYDSAYPQFYTWLESVVDAVLAQKAIPILTTLPPRADQSGLYTELAHQMSVEIYKLAQAKQIPLIQLHLPLEMLPSKGLISDGIHLSVSPNGPCAFATSDLTYGMNMRNKLTLEALDRLRRTVYGSENSLPEVLP